MNVVEPTTVLEQQLAFEEECRTKFAELIDVSIVTRYDGPLERLGEDKHGGLCYRPLDTDYVRELLIGIWGDLVAPQTIEDAFDRLMHDVDEWPYGYCEQENVPPLSALDPE